MKILKYLIGIVLLILTIFVIFAAIVIYSFKNGGMPEKPFNTSQVLDSLGLSNKKYYEFGEYRIYPTEKAVLVYQNEYSPCYIDTLINFDSTTLVFYGNTFGFEEHLDGLIDYNTLKVLDYNIDKDYSWSICKDRNTIYKGLSGDKIDISGFKCINDWIYLDNDDEIYYLTTTGDLSKMDIYDQRPHIPSLEYIGDGCFYNKDGLYELQRQYNYKDERNIWFNAVPVRIEESKGKNIRPFVTPLYFTYGSNVYLRQSRLGWGEQNFQKLEINGTNLKEFILSDSYHFSYILTDGKNSYVFPDKIQNKINTNSISEWKQLSRDNQRFTYDEKANILYYASNNIPDIGRSISGALICIGDKFWLINFSGYDNEKGKMISLDKVMIDAGKGYEELDISNYKYIDADLYLYKDTLYGNRCTPVNESTDLELRNFYPIQHNYISTQYFTDGKVLYYNDEMYRYTLPRESLIPLHVIKDVDFNSLKVISKTMLIDKNNIYIGLTIIPIDSLGVKVKVY
ncbi:MAG: hypothetical protein ACK5KL_09435 [Dysgonomonas sp.]